MHLLSAFLLIVSPEYVRLDVLARCSLFSIVRRLCDIFDEVTALEAAAALAQAGTLFGRMQGAFAGAVDTARLHADQQSTKPMFGFMRRR